jgi:hypothetical protein
MERLGMVTPNQDKRKVKENAVIHFVVTRQPGQADAFHKMRIPRPALLDAYYVPANPTVNASDGLLKAYDHA